VQTAVITSHVKAIRLMLQSLALGLGAYLVISQQMSPGAIFAASLLVSRALSPIEMVTAAWKSLAQARSAYEQIGNLFEGVGPVPQRTWLPEVQGRLQVEALSVASPARDRLLLQDQLWPAAGRYAGRDRPTGRANRLWRARWSGLRLW
jgi:ATP-binding cassette subfamily C protein